MYRRSSARLLAFLIVIGLTQTLAWGVQSKRKRKPAATSATAKKTAPVKRSNRGSTYGAPTYADSTFGDNIDGEDLMVRRAAVEALGPYNGTVVVVDPQTGRVLSIVNQKVAFSSGFQPCSTIKVVAALAALSEGLIERNTMVRLYGRTSMNLTEALARSDNPFFANLGIKLGFERVSYYAKLFGLGERAGLNIAEEQPGILPSTPPKNGGVGMMTSFGEGISLTPLELAGLLTAISNGGTLYHLQYPKNEREIADFVPKVKRQLDIEPWIPQVKPGMMAAVEYGTARRANYDPTERVLGKTGTCTDYQNRPVHLGWFGSFNDVGRNKLVVVVLLTGGKSINGPVASGIGGAVYRNLSQKSFFATSPAVTSSSLVSTQACCAQ